MTKRGSITCARVTLPWFRDIIKDEDLARDAEQARERSGPLSVREQNAHPGGHREPLHVASLILW